MIYAERPQRLKFGCDGDELAVQPLQRVIEWCRGSVGFRHAAFVVGITINIVGNALRPVCQGGVDQIAHFVGRGNARRARGGGGAGHPIAGLHDVQERHSGGQRLLADQGQVEEILPVVAAVGELIVIVTQQGGPDDVHILAQVLHIGGHGFSRHAQLLVVGVGREQIDICQVGGTFFPQMCHQLPQGGKLRGAWLVDQVKGIQCRVSFDPAEQCIQRLGVGQGVW